jgi:hypothetical protein
MSLRATPVALAVGVISPDRSATIRWTDGQRTLPRPRNDYISRASRRSDLHTEGVKGLLALNGGGILALLTFITQLVVRDAANRALVEFITAAIACFATGLIVAAPINHLRYETSRLFDNAETKERGRKYGLAHRILFYASLVLFVIGVATALVGMWRHGVPTGAS